MTEKQRRHEAWNGLDRLGGRCESAVAASAGLALATSVALVIAGRLILGRLAEWFARSGFTMGWRSTWIRMLPNNKVIMPNSVLSGSSIINYFYPEKELSVPVEVSVHYDCDLEHVERVTLEVAREILRTHEWGVTDYDTFVVFHTFGESSIDFTVMLRAREYFNRFWVKSAFIKALHKRYAAEGITIPFPIRALNFDQEGKPDRRAATHSTRRPNKTAVTS